MSDSSKERTSKRFACLIVEDEAEFAALAESVV